MANGENFPSYKNVEDAIEQGIVWIDDGGIIYNGIGPGYYGHGPPAFLDLDDGTAIINGRLVTKDFGNMSPHQQRYYAESHG